MSFSLNNKSICHGAVFFIVLFFLARPSISTPHSSTCTKETGGLLTCGHFDQSFCFGQGWSTGQVRWKRTKVITTSSGHSITRNNLSNDYFVYMDVKDNEFKTGSTADFDVWLKDLPQGVDGVCISFLYASVKDGNTVPKVTLSIQGEKTEEIGSIQEDTNGVWVKKSFEACLGKFPSFISFRSTKESPNTVVAFDDVIVTHSHVTCQRDSVKA